MTTYYIRKSGLDTNDGLTPSTAWLTIGKANTSMSNGDTVYVGPGDYSTENIQPSANWSNRTWIGDPQGIYTGDTPGDVKVKGLFDNTFSFTNCVFQRFYFVGVAASVYYGISISTLPATTSSITVDYCKINKTVRIDYRGSIYFRNNIVNLDRVGGGGSVRLWSYSYTLDIEVDAYNNTIYSDSSAPGYNTLKIDVYSAGSADKVATINSKNNIIITASGSTSYGTLYSGWHSPTWGGYTIYNTDYNFHSYTDKCMEIRDWNSTTAVMTYYYYNTLSEAKSEGHDTHSLEGDPLIESDKYHLKSNSPCVNNGSNVGLILDIDGNLRPIGNYDIGAHEYQPKAVIKCINVARFCLSHSNVQIGNRLDALLKAIYYSGTWQGFIGMNCFNQNILVNANEIKNIKFWNRIIDGANLVFRPEDYT